MVAGGLSEDEARARFYMVDRPGLLTSDMDGLEPFQVPLAQDPAAVADWDRADPSQTTLLDVIANASPSVLIGVTGVPGHLHRGGRPGAWPRPTRRPSSSRCRTRPPAPRPPPTDVLTWSDGRALVATGSPFDPVTVDGVTHTIAQSNNSYIFPGVGLGVRASGARRVSDGMFMAAARALADAVAAHAHRRQPAARPGRGPRASAGPSPWPWRPRPRPRGWPRRPRPTSSTAAVDATTWQAEYRPFVPAD